MDVFKDYSEEKKLPEVDLLPTSDVPTVIKKFYVGLRSTVIEKFYFAVKSKIKVQEKDANKTKLDAIKSGGVQAESDDNEDSIYIYVYIYVHIYVSFYVKC